MEFFQQLVPDGMSIVNKFGKDAFHFERKEVEDATKMGALGLFMFGAYSLLSSKRKKMYDPNDDLEDEVYLIHHDELLFKYFKELQAYRDINKSRFKLIVQTTDRLLHLEKALVDKEKAPSKKIEALAWTFFKQTVNNMFHLQTQIKYELPDGAKHAFAFNVIGQQIFKRLQEHLLIIIQIISNADPYRIIDIAKKEIHSLKKKHKLKRKRKRKRREYIEK